MEEECLDPHKFCYIFFIDWITNCVEGQLTSDYLANKVIWVKERGSFKKKVLPPHCLAHLGYPGNAWFRTGKIYHKDLHRYWGKGGRKKETVFMLIVQEHWFLQRKDRPEYTSQVDRECVYHCLHRVVLE